MNARDLLDRLIDNGMMAARPGPGVTRSAMAGPVEVAAARRADERFLRARWRERVGNSPQPYLLLADEPETPGKLRVLGPNRADGAVHVVEAQLLQEALKRAAGERHPLDAVRGLSDELARLGGEGLTCRGLLTRHTLEHRFRGEASRWLEAASIARGIRLDWGWRQVLEGLGLQIERLAVRGYLARYEGRPVAVVHPKRQVRDLTRIDSGGHPPEGLLLLDCESHGASYGILVADGRFRLFDSTSPAAASEWLELDLRLLGDERLPYTSLLGPRFLANGGLAELRAESARFGAALHKRIDRTIRSEVLPALAAGMGAWAETAGMDLTEDQKREEIEQAALTLVFRLVFVLYCESAGYLPLGRRPYAVKSLSSLVDEAAATKELLSPASVSLWRGFGNLVHAMRRGNPAWEVPAYNGALFSARDLRGAELLEEMEIPDPVFGSVLVALGRDPETGLGADFSTLEIAHIGHIYESLLSLRLALALRPLRYEGRNDRYVPVDENASEDDRAARQRNAAGAEVQAGELLWQTHEGGRKAGGVYYTPVDLVRHLVERSVLPAFERRLKKAAALANTDATRAARELLEFAVVDPACGSAHFLVQVAETLAERTVRFLAEHNLPLIAEEIEKLRAGATARADVDDVALLRRLLVKNCVFGVDVSPMGAEVAKLSLWLATFVPGLSLAHLGRNVLVGDSLVGVADAERLQEELELPIFAQKIRLELQEATRRIRSLLEIQDRTPEEVQKSQQADREAEKAAAGVRRVFDLWTAEQFGLEGARHHVGFHGVDVLDGSGWASSELVAEAGELARRHGFLHWPLAFPQVFARDRPGFDVVVGNPPWEEVTIEELSFYGLFRPGLTSMAEDDRARTIRDMVDERPELPWELEQRQVDLERRRTALKAGDYPPMVGDSDLYKYFCVRYRNLVREEGFMGVVLPRSAFSAKGSAGFRDWLFSGCTTHRVDFLLNRARWIFDSEPRYSIALVAAERRPPTEEHRISILGTATTRNEWREQSQSPGIGLLKSAFGPRWETPLLRSQAEADLLAKLRYGTSPFPHGAGGRWQCFPVAELHETSRKPFWLGQTEGRPVWKGESFDQYQPTGTGERVCQDRARIEGKLVDLEDELRKPKPGAQSLLSSSVDLADRRQAVLTELGRARVGFRDVTNRTNSRTVLSCLIPPGVLLTNKAPYLAWGSGAEREQAACLGLMNSLAFDWQARRFIETNVNFFLLELLHLPDLDENNFDAIADAAARLSAVDSRFAEFAAATGVDCGPLDEAACQHLRLDIDARVALAWNLSAADLDLILQDFTEAAVPPAYRASLLDRFQELT